MGLFFFQGINFTFKAGSIFFIFKQLVGLFIYFQGVRIFIQRTVDIPKVFVDVRVVGYQFYRVFQLFCRLLEITQAVVGPAKTVDNEAALRFQRIRL